MKPGNVTYAIILALFAGLSTGLGGLLVFLFKKTNLKFLSVALGFSSGVMIYISFMEILPQAKLHLVKSMGVRPGQWYVFLAFLAGIFLIALIDRLVPESENPHEPHKTSEINKCNLVGDQKRLMKTGFLMMLAITVHNFPEGMATFIAGISKPSLGIAIAIAVAIHNIPEGIAVAIPVYCSSGSKRRAMVMSLLSGLAEPLGAIIAFLILMPFINDFVFGLIFASIAGIMVFISIDELLPAAREYGEHHLSIFGLVAGMIVMGVSLLII